MRTLLKPAPKSLSQIDEDFDLFLNRLVPKTRAAVDKHVAACSADAALAYGRTWKRLAELLARYAPHAAEVTGAALRFYILDGKYRRQVFVLEDLRDGIIQVYLPDVLAAALEQGILGPPEGASYPVLRAGIRLDLEIINADTKDLPDFCKAMLGWGRRAIKTGLPVSAGEPQVHIIERLCALAADTWPIVEKAPAIIATP